MAKKPIRRVIYRTTNLVNGKIYVGKDKYNNPEYLGSGLLLKKAIDKYGKENFLKEILEYCDSDIQSNEKEIFWISELRSMDRNVGYNLASGGEGLSNPSDDIRRKISLSIQKVVALGGGGRKLKGRSFSEDHKYKLRLAKKNISKETREKMSLGHIGRKASDDTKKKMSQIRRGKKLKPMSQEARQHLSEIRKGKRSRKNYAPLTDEVKKKISESKKGVPLSEDAKKKMKGRVLSEETKRKIGVASSNRSPEARKNLSDAVKKSWEKRKQNIA